MPIVFVANAPKAFNARILLVGISLFLVTQVARGASAVQVPPSSPEQGLRPAQSVALKSDTAVAPKRRVSIQERVMRFFRSRQFFQDRALYDLLRSRCRFYILRSSSSYVERRLSHSRCDRLAALTLRALSPRLVTFTDHRTGNESVEPAVFGSDLKELIASPRVAAFISNLQGRFEMAMLAPIDVDVFHEALRASGSEREAMRWIAVLFQDTSASKVQLAWIRKELAESNPDPLARDTIDRLQSLIDGFIAVSVGVTRLQGDLRFLPASLDRPSTVGEKFPQLKQYHFYVPAYLAHRLVKEGLSRKDAVFAAFLFNYLYEVMDEKGPILSVFREPPRLERRGSVADVYLGYLGALYGAELVTGGGMGCADKPDSTTDGALDNTPELDRTDALDRETFFKIFEASPEKGMLRILAELSD